MLSIMRRAQFDNGLQDDRSLEQRDLFSPLRDPFNLALRRLDQY
jgi:hypothetical protein